jgi:GPH family glycoside/pentoside/hexuronide:cation symporter
MTEPGNPVSGTPAGRPLRVSHGTRLGYGLGDVGFVMVWQGSALFLLFFYTETLGLPPWMAGSIYLAGMIWDALTDPLVATWIERRARRAGRYRQFMAMAALPIAVSYPLMFSGPLPALWATALWALLSHLLFRTAFTFASMPYNALPTRLTGDPGPRNGLAAIRVVGAALGGLLVAVGTPVLVSFASSLSSPGLAPLFAASLVGLLAGLALWTSSQLMDEPNLPVESDAGHRFGAELAQLFRSVLHERRFRILICVMILCTLSFGLHTQTVLYWLEYQLQLPALAPVALAVPALAMILTAPLWAFLAHRISKTATLCVGLLIAAAGYAGLALLPQAAAVPAIAFLVVAASGNACLPVMFWSLMPDAIDQHASRTGERIEARLFGLATFAQKSAAGLAALVIGVLLSLSGYVAETMQTQPARLTILALATALPALCLLATLLVLRDYDRDDR